MFKEVKIDQLEENFFKEMSVNFALISAGNLDGFNTMTIAWATFGVLWNKYVNYAYVRRSRYTFKFMEESEYYTIAFFDEDYKKDLAYLGRTSGRDLDKLANTKLNPFYFENSIFFKEARLVLVIKKMSQRLLAEEFVPVDVRKAHYPSGDYHEEYIGEIVKAYISI